MIRYFYLIAAITVSHLLFGWIFGVLLVAAVAGYVFGDRPVLICGLTGFILSALEVGYTFWVAYEPTMTMMNISARILVDFPDYSLIIISIALPVIFYMLAAYFSYNAYYVYRKLTV